MNKISFEEYKEIINGEDDPINDFAEGNITFEKVKLEKINKKELKKAETRNEVAHLN